MTSIKWLSLTSLLRLQESADEAAARAKAKRASMVKKALRYFEDKSNRSMSEDNLFTRRKNLAVHLGLDDKVSLREIQKINTYSLPVPSSATPFNATAAASPRYFPPRHGVWKSTKMSPLISFFKHCALLSNLLHKILGKSRAPKVPKNSFPHRFNQLKEVL